MFAVHDTGSFHSWNGGLQQRQRQEEGMETGGGNGFGVASVAATREATTVDDRGQGKN